LEQPHNNNKETHIKMFTSVYKSSRPLYL